MITTATHANDLYEAAYAHGFNDGKSLKDMPTLTDEQKIAEMHQAISGFMHNAIICGKHYDINDLSKELATIIYDGFKS